MTLSEITREKLNPEPNESKEDSLLKVERALKLQEWARLPVSEAFFAQLEEMSLACLMQAEDLASLDEKAGASQIRALLVKSKTLKEIANYGRTAGTQS